MCCYLCCWELIGVWWGLSFAGGGWLFTSTVLVVRSVKVSFAVMETNLTFSSSCMSISCYLTTSLTGFCPEVCSAWWACNIHRAVLLRNNNYHTVKNNNIAFRVVERYIRNAYTLFYRRVCPFHFEIQQCKNSNEPGTKWKQLNWNANEM